MIPKILLKESIVAPPGFNRWRVPPALHSHSSVYRFSLCMEHIQSCTHTGARCCRRLGQWTGPPEFGGLGYFSVGNRFFLGLAAAVAGKWLETCRTEMCGGWTAAILWGGGFLIGSAGVAFSSALAYLPWLRYAGGMWAWGWGLCFPSKVL